VAYQLACYNSAGAATQGTKQLKEPSKAQKKARVNRRP
jgi:hypothetical protein